MKINYMLMLSALFLGSDIVIGANDEKNMTQIIATENYNTKPEIVKKWEKICQSSKGVMVAKIKQTHGVYIVFYAGSNYNIPVERLIDESRGPCTFYSIDAAAEFLKANPTGRNLIDAYRLKPNSSVVELLPFTDSERAKLGLGKGNIDPKLGKPPEEIRERRVTYPLFDFVRKGALYWLDIDGGVFQYRPPYPVGGLSIISENTEKTQKMISTEIIDQGQMHDFLLRKLPYVAVYVFGKRGTYIITPSFIKKRAEVPENRWSKFSTKVARAQSEELLKKYSVDSTPVSINDDKWSLTMHVTNQDGSIEKWMMTGDVFPFTINHQEEIVLEKAGTIVPYPLKLSVGTEQ